MKLRFDKPPSLLRILAARLILRVALRLTEFGTAIRRFLVRRLKRSAVRHIRLAGKRIVQAEKMEG